MEPLTLDMLHSAIAIDPEDEQLDESNKLDDPKDILEICGSLIRLNPDNTVVEFAHFSVVEWLKAPQLPDQSRNVNFICEAEAHLFTGTASLRYLLWLVQSNPSSPSFSLYAARCWIGHIKRGPADDYEKLECGLMRKLFSANKEMDVWLNLSNPDFMGRVGLASRHREKFASPLYYSSLLGLNSVTKWILEQGVEVNAQGGYYGTALNAASARGHERVVQLLLDKGADVNAQGGLYGNALQAALVYGKEKVVQLLRNHGFH